MESVHFILEQLFSAAMATLLQIFILIGPGLIFAFLMHFVAGLTENRAYHFIGRKPYLYLFGWLGTAVHEIGHAMMCPIFGHKITGIVLFNPDPNSQTLGSVSHSYNPRNFYSRVGNFFIGIGPIISGCIVVYVSTYYLIDKDFVSYFNTVEISHLSFSSVESFKHMLFSFMSSLDVLSSSVLNDGAFSRWEFYLFLYILFSVGSSITLSLSDIRGAFWGFLTFSFLLLLFNVLALLFLENGSITKRISTITPYFNWFYIMMLFALFLNLAIFTILFVLERLKRVWFSR